MQPILFLLILIAFIYYIKHNLAVPKEIEHVDIFGVQVEQGHFPYVKRNYLMTKAEFVFYQELEKAIGNKYYIIPQVSLAKLVEVSKTEIMRRTYHNKIDRKSVDFVLFSKPYFCPQLIIELDDRTHDRHDRKFRDEWVDSIAKEVGIKIVHFKNSLHYNQTEIISTLNTTDI